MDGNSEHLQIAINTEKDELYISLRTIHEDMTIVLAEEHISLDSVPEECIQNAVDSQNMLQCRLCERSCKHDEKCIIEQTIRHLLKLSTHDPLTGLPNRRFMDIKLSDLVNNERRQKVLKKEKPGLIETVNVIIMVDVDNFGDLNKQYGHHIGDKALKVIAKVLKKHTKIYDWIARYGGEEFLIVLLKILPKDIVKACERLRRVVEEQVQEQMRKEFPRFDRQVTISMGISTSDDWEHDEDDRAMIQFMVTTSDTCALRAKKSGKNTIVFDNPGYNKTYQQLKYNSTNRRTR